MSQSPYHNHHRCCDWKSWRCAGGTSARTGIHGRNEHSRPLDPRASGNIEPHRLLAKNTCGERALKLVVSGVLHAFGQTT